MDESKKPKLIKIGKPKLINNNGIVLNHLLVKDGNWFESQVVNYYVWLITICLHLLFIFFISLIPAINITKPEPIPVSIIIPPEEIVPEEIIPPEVQKPLPVPIEQNIKPIPPEQIQEEITPSPQLIEKPIIETKKITIPKLEKLAYLPEIQEEVRIEKNYTYDVKLKTKKLIAKPIDDLSRLKKIDTEPDPEPKPRENYEVKTKTINRTNNKTDLVLDKISVPTNEELEKIKLDAQRKQELEAQMRAQAQEQKAAQERALQQKLANEKAAKEAALKDALLRESLAKNLPKAEKGVAPATSPNAGANASAASASSSSSSAPAAVSNIGAVPPSSSGASGGAGSLPRQPRIYSSPNSGNLFETKENNSLLAKMRRTADCTKIGEERDPRCPKFTAPNSNRGSIPQALPKGVVPRNNNTIDPLPPCPPNSPHSNFGVICMGPPLKKNQ